MISSTLTLKLSKSASGFDFDLLIMAVLISLLLTEPRQSSIEWSLLKRETNPTRFHPGTGLVVGGYQIRRTDSVKRVIPLANLN
jgi:hypothetical protein